MNTFPSMPASVLNVMEFAAPNFEALSHLHSLERTSIARELGDGIQLLDTGYKDEWHPRWRLRWLVDDAQRL